MNKLTKSHINFVIFFLLIVANSRYLVDEGLSSYLEYFVHGILTALSCYTFIKDKKDDKIKTIIIFFIVVVFFSIGIMLQGLIISTKIRLIFTMVTLAAYIILSGNLLNNYKNIRSASYGMFIGTIFTTFIGIITGTSMNETIYDKTYRLIADVGFTGGLQFKNYYATVVLASFMGIYLYYKYEQKKKIDFFMLILLCILELLSGSKGGYLLFIVFIILQQFKKLNIKNKIKISKGVKYISVIIIMLISIFIFKWGYNNILVTSSTYGYRMRGVENYINYVKNDYFHLIFGNAEMAYSNSKYVQNIRNFLIKNNIEAYNGSYEMGFINALIKNGVLGLIGFIICYYIIVKKALLFNEKEYKVTIISILIVLLISSLVESYVCNIHAIFGVYCYILMSGIINMAENKENLNNKKVSV